ncbi:GntR family transcriptional regulator [Zhaonella formicivorans]|uniref:GntR family transcriptional regulator n=1 Tax=Zhaonella formicivorans TaxID=2528593 RepID=UPI0010DF9BD9|nr:GntR family transcriptional regulator [Zhaonella formicivorans]
MKKVINEEIPIPIYFQVKQDLLNKIFSGALKPNDRIPSEATLAEEYGISRMTARHAVTQLVNEGYLYRVHGRGTFVSKPRVEKSFAPLTGFAEDMRARGYMPTSKVLLNAKEIPSRRVQEILELNNGEEVYRVKRLRYANAEPIVLQQAFLPVKLCPGLLEEDLENNSLYEILDKKFHLKLYRAKQKMEAVSASKEQAELLGIKKNSPLLSVTRVTFLENDTPVEFVEIWYRGDRYTFEVDLFRDWNK